MPMCMCILLLGVRDRTVLCVRKGRGHPLEKQPIRSFPFPSLFDSVRQRHVCDVHECYSVRDVRVSAGPQLGRLRVCGRVRGQGIPGQYCQAVQRLVRACG